MVYNSDIELALLILGGIVLVTFPSLLIIVFLRINSKRKLKFEKELEFNRAKFKEELLASKFEIKEQELKYFAMELHDNIGQLANQLSMYHKSTIKFLPKESHEELKEVEKLISHLVSEIKRLSIGYEGKSVYDNGLVKAIGDDILRIANFTKIKFEVILPENEFTISYDCAVFVFRIYQELINNALKYSNATKINVSLTISPENIGELTIQDNGDGFNLDNIKNGLGVSNVRERAKLINAELDYVSHVGRGTNISLKFKLQNE
jgi:signal transduction histidine kinase